ncbi:unnamed protein product [Nippostrongylus brasiliensis]|uniref:Inner membrane protein n=1 Tax=Nippostrongylus brasiliensis TaxID=27835 RepID=A0A0N4XEM8_NIPBR|nr:unnamed protein product [Nippostrongylus brasiliensis]
MASVALLLCMVAMVLTLASRTATARLIRLGFIATFVLNATNLYFLNKSAVNQVSSG